MLQYEAIYAYSNFPSFSDNFTTQLLVLNIIFFLQKASQTINVRVRLNFKELYEFVFTFILIVLMY